MTSNTQTPPSVTRLLTPDDVAELLRLSKTTVYRLCRRGEIPTLRIGGSLRVDPDALDGWIRRQSA
jgi:excisionase family DNA binding protein